MPPGMMSGRAIGQGILANQMLNVELLYSVMIIAICLVIYFKTKEIYDLSSHKGIKYFRYTFLFFAFAFALKYLSKYFFPFFIQNGLIELTFFLSMLILLLTLYTTLMAGIYLINSLSSKKDHILLWHLIALCISILAILTNVYLTYILPQIALLIYGFAVLYSNYKKSRSKKHQDSYIIYLLLLIFWLVSIIDLFIPNFLQLAQLIIYLISTGLFLAIFYKVVKRIGSNSK
ncbi:MAG: hypothetical protein ABIB79_05130 [archaeon]